VIVSVPAGAGLAGLGLTPVLVLGLEPAGTVTVEPGMTTVLLGPATTVVPGLLLLFPCAEVGVGAITVVPGDEGLAGGWEVVVAVVVCS
jgi:hypothetical protein